jgi:hypothetical protein
MDIDSIAQLFISDPSGGAGKGAKTGFAIGSVVGSLTVVATVSAFGGPAAKNGGDYLVGLLAGAFIGGVVGAVPFALFGAIAGEKTEIYFEKAR